MIHAPRFDTSTAAVLPQFDAMEDWEVQIELSGKYLALQTSARHAVAQFVLFYDEVKQRLGRSDEAIRKIRAFIDFFEPAVQKTISEINELTLKDELTDEERTAAKVLVSVSNYLMRIERYLTDITTFIRA